MASVARTTVLLLLLVAVVILVPTASAAGRMLANQVAGAGERGEATNAARILVDADVRASADILGIRTESAVHAKGGGKADSRSNINTVDAGSLGVHTQIRGKADSRGFRGPFNP